MRTFSFIIAFAAFIVAGPTLAGSADGSLPGIGTFSYNGSPVLSTPVTPDTLVAGLTLAKRS